MIEDISKQNLQEKLDNVKSSVLPKQWWYYHFEGIQNFIFHLDSFPSDRIKNKMAENIYDYLRQTEEKINQNLTPGRAMKQLAPSFWAISQVYKTELSFVSRPFYPFLIVGLLILFLILNHFYSTSFSLLTVVALLLARIIFTQLKTRARKVY